MEDINRDIVQRVYISKRIKEIRNKLGLSMTEFGKLLDTSKNSVSQWESAKVIPNSERIRKIAELGNIPIKFLYLSDLDVVDLSIKINPQYTKLMSPPSYFNDYESCIVYRFDGEISFLVINGQHSLKVSCYIYDDDMGYCSIIIDAESLKKMPHQFMYFTDHEFEDSKYQCDLAESINKQLPKDLNLCIETITFNYSDRAFEERSLLPYSDSYSYDSNPILKEIQAKLLELRENNPMSTVITGEVYEWLKHEIKNFEMRKEYKSKRKD